MCDLSDNIYDIEFINFKIRDIDTGKKINEISKNKSFEMPKLTDESNAVRFIRYNFSSNFLKIKTIGAS